MIFADIFRKKKYLKFNVARANEAKMYIETRKRSELKERECETGYQEWNLEKKKRDEINHNFFVI